MATARTELLRLFAAVELPEEVQAALAALQDDLRRRGLDGLRWVRPQGIHLTLKFLGETPAEKLPAIRRALTEAVKGVPPHRLSLGAVGTFGGRRGPQVLWLNLEGDLVTLGRLQQRVEKALAALGFPREKRDFAPHLTLARVRPETARAVASRLDEAAAAAPAPQGTIEVREVSLMRSSLQSGGAVYERLDAFVLNKGAAPGVE